MSLLLTIVMIFASVTTCFAEDQGSIDETVYALLNSNGEVNQIIVTDHIQKNKDLNEINVNSNLNNIQLLMTDADFVQEDKTLNLKSQESDIYLRGDSQEILPVETIITYYLDGKEISDGDLLGKSGHFKMIIEQINHEKRIIEVQGQDKEISLPFETALTITFDNDIFENVSISSGTIKDDGDMKVLVSVLTPGLLKDFDLKTDFLNDSVEIEADVEDFEMSSIYMTTICKLPEIDLSSLQSEILDVNDHVDEFSQAGQTLLEGSQNLNSGLQTYFGKQSEAFEAFDNYLQHDQKLLNSIIAFDQGFMDFTTALSLYTSGVSEILTGISSLSQVSPSLVEAMTGMEIGLKQVLVENESNGSLLAGFAQVKESVVKLDQGLQALNQASMTIAEKTPTLVGASDQLLVASNQLTSGASQLLAYNNNLSSAVDQLDQASQEILSGNQVFTSGVEAFKRDAIDRLVSEVDHSVKRIEDFQNRYDQTLAYVEDYTSFTGENNQLEGSLIFIMKTSAIK